MSTWLIHVHRALGKPTTKIHCSALCLPQLGFALHCRISEQVHTCCRIPSLPSHPGSLSHSLSHHHHPPLSLPILHFGIWHQIFLCSYSNLPMFVCLYIVFANKYLYFLKLDEHVCWIYFGFLCQSESVNEGSAPGWLLILWRQPWRWTTGHDEY